MVRDKYLLANDSPTQNLDLIRSGHHHGGLINYKTIKRIEKTNDFLIKLFPKYKEAIEKMRYFGLCENPLNHPLPFINPYARGMHTFGGVPTIISKGVGNESASGINRKNPKNQFVTQVDVIAKIKNNI